MRPLARSRWIAGAIAFLSLSACADGLERMTVPTADGDRVLANRVADVDTSRFTRRFHSAGGGPVFIRLTGTPHATAVSRLVELGLRPPEGRQAPVVFDGLETVWGQLSALAVERIAALPFVVLIESSDDEDGIATFVDPNAAEIKWNLHRVRAPDIWRDVGATGWRQLSSTGWQSAGVWVLDDGMDYRLRRFDANPWEFYFATNQGNFTTDPTPVYLGSHGTAVAGFVSAEPNGIWAAGVAPRAWVSVAKVLPTGADWGSIVAGLDAAYVNGPTVINMSLGNCGAVPPSTVHAAIQRLVNRVPADAGHPGVGVSMVAAAGNGLHSTLQCGNRLVAYPAAYNEVIAVGAIDINNQVNTNYSFGSQVELVAPGLCVDGLAVGGGVSPCISGTSFAAPHVSGLIAAIRARHNTWSAAHVRTRLQQTATKISGQSVPRDQWYGFGLVNAYNVLVPPLTVSIGGQKWINQSGWYVWSADASGGDGNYTYQWYRSTDEINWTPVGTAQTYSEYVTAGWYHFYLRVEVASANQTASAETPILVEMYCDVWNPCY
jgi:subtilisin family serine protease